MAGGPARGVLTLTDPFNGPALVALADRVESPAPAAPVPRFLAAHGPRLQRLAAAGADGMVTYLMPPEPVAASRERIGGEVLISVVCFCLAVPEAGAARAHMRTAPAALERQAVDVRRR